MAINLFCKQCKVTSSLRAKVCGNCGQPFGASRKYRVAVKLPDGKRVSRVVESLSIAKKLEAKLKTEAMQGELLGVRSVPRLGVVWERYLAWAKLNKKSWKTDQYLWKKHLGPRLEGKRMDRVVSMDVQTILDGMRLQGSYAPATVKHVLVLLRRVYNWSREMGLYKGANPTNGIKPPRLNNQRVEFLSKQELGRLLEVLETWKNRRVALLVKFALFTGCRRGELLRLRWDDVDLDALTLRLRDPKGGTDVILPLSEAAGDVLEAARGCVPAAECQYVFPNGKGQRRRCIKKSWARIKEMADLPKDFRFHGLRHSFASYLASSGEVTLYTIQKLLNHKSPRMTVRYAHLLDDTLRVGAGVMGRLNQR